MLDGRRRTIFSSSRTASTRARYAYHEHTPSERRVQKENRQSNVHCGIRRYQTIGALHDGSREAASLHFLPVERFRPLHVQNLREGRDNLEMRHNDLETHHQGVFPLLNEFQHPEISSRNVEYSIAREGIVLTYLIPATAPIGKDRSRAQSRRLSPNFVLFHKRISYPLVDPEVFVPTDWAAASLAASSTSAPPTCS